MAARKPKATAPAIGEKVFINEFPIGNVTVDKELQARARMDTDAVADYRDVIFEGGTLPPLELTKDGETYWLTDGFHRHAAYAKLGITTVPVNVTEGTKTEAIMAALGANQSHGLRRSNADKRKAVEMAFGLMGTLEENWTDQRVSDLTGVSAMFVGNVRKENYAETYAKPRTGESRVVTRTAPKFVEKKEKDESPETEPKTAGGPEAKYPLGIAIDKLRNRMAATEQALADTLKVFPTEEAFNEALEGLPELKALWETLGESAAAIHRAFVPDSAA